HRGGAGVRQPGPGQPAAGLGLEPGPDHGAGRRHAARGRGAPGELPRRPALHRHRPAAADRRWPMSLQERPADPSPEQDTENTSTGSAGAKRPVGPSLVVGALLVLVVVGMALLSFVWTPHDPTLVDAGHRLETPNVGSCGVHT